MNGGAEAQQQKLCQTFLEDQAEANSLEAGSRTTDASWICLCLLAGRRKLGDHSILIKPSLRNAASSTDLGSLMTASKRSEKLSCCLPWAENSAGVVVQV